MGEGGFNICLISENMGSKTQETSQFDVRTENKGNGAGRRHGSIGWSKAVTPEVLSPRSSVPMKPEREVSQSRISGRGDEGGSRKCRLPLVSSTW